jgi:hypothetical protein
MQEVVDYYLKCSTGGINSKSMITGRKRWQNKKSEDTIQSAHPKTIVLNLG